MTFLVIFDAFDFNCQLAIDFIESMMSDYGSKHRATNKCAFN